MAEIGTARFALAAFIDKLFAEGGRKGFRLMFWRIVLGGLYFLYAEITVIFWFWIPAMGDWFAAKGSIGVRPDIGNTAYVKGLQLDGYSSPSNASLLNKCELGGLMMLAFLVLFGAMIGPKLDKFLPVNRTAIAILFWIVPGSLWLGGGHWMALALTGSWRFPQNPAYPH